MMEAFEEDPTQGVWVNAQEGADITGINREELRRLADQMTKQPEQNRIVRVVQRARELRFWLPDLVQYIGERGASLGK
jgi:hypothetical protein